MKLKFINTPFPSAGYEREYVAFMNRFMKILQSLTVERIVNVYRIALEEHKEAVRKDAWPDLIESAIIAIRADMNAPLREGQRLIVDMAERTSGFSKKQWQRVAEAQTGIDFLRSESWLRPLLKSWAIENARLIGSIQEKYLAQVAQRSQDMVRQGRSVGEFREALVEIYKINKKQANVIARTEIAKLNGQITKARQQSLGIREYTWRTVGDERVRAKHQALHGKICRWDNPAVYRDEGSSEWKSRLSIGGYIGDPGQDYMCRCTAAAHIEELLERLGV